MYDPTTARFLQEDTYTGDPNDPLSLNLYTYCHNEPLMYTDPAGHDATMITYNGRRYTLQEMAVITTQYDEVVAAVDAFNLLSNKSNDLWKLKSKKTSPLSKELLDCFSSSTNADIKETSETMRYIEYLLMQNNDAVKNNKSVYLGLYQIGFLNGGTDQTNFRRFELLRNMLLEGNELYKDIWKAEKSKRDTETKNELLSMGTNFIPGYTFKRGIDEGASGREYFTNREMSIPERIFGVAAGILDLKGLGSGAKAIKALGEVAEEAKVIGNLERLGAGVGEVKQVTKTVENTNEISRNAAFRQAKKEAGIPSSSQYKTHKKVFDGSSENRNVYEFEVNGQKKYIIEHTEDKMGRGPHFHGADDLKGSPFDKGRYNQYPGHFPEDINGYKH